MTADDILTSDGRYRTRAAKASDTVRDAAEVLASRVTELLLVYGDRPYITSGYRTPAANRAANGAAKSAHIEGRAVDLHDPDGKLGQWCMKNLYLLEQHGLWMEDTSATPTWVHLQSRPAKNRVFRP
jgi:hypothetical protein